LGLLAQTPPTNVITAVVGADFALPFASSPAASFPLPPNEWGKPAVDSAGNVYFALGTRHVIVRWSPNGRVQVIAGTGINGFSGDGGPATTASLNTPKDIAIDSKGNIYFADGVNRRIRRITPDGRIDTFAGGGTIVPTAQGTPLRSASLNGLGPVAIDSADAVYFNADSGSIAKVDPNSSNVRLIAGIPGQQGTFSASGVALQTQFRQIFGMAADRGGNLYFTDFLSLSVGRITPAGRAELLVTRAATAGFPNDIAIDQNGNVYVTQFNSPAIWRLTTGNVIERFAGDLEREGFTPSNTPRDQARFGPNLRMIVDSRGTFFITDSRNGRLRRMTSVVDNIAGVDIAYAGEAGLATAASVPAPTYVAQAPDGTIYFSDNTVRAVFSVDTRGILRRFAGSGILNGDYVDGRPALDNAFGAPYGVAVDSAGTVYVADDDCSIKSIATGGVMRIFAGASGHCRATSDGLQAKDARFGQLRGILVDPSNNILVTDITNHKVWRIAPSGVVTTFAGTGVAGISTTAAPATQSPLNQPSDVRFMNNAYLIADSNNHRVARVADGRLTNFAGIGQRVSSGDGGPATSAGLSSPTALATDTAGNVYISEQSGHKIRRVTPTGVIGTYAGTGDRGARGDGGLAVAAQLSAPAGLLVVRDGRLLIADRENGRLRAVLPTAPAVQFPTTPVTISASDTQQRGTISLATPVNGLGFETSVRFTGTPANWLRVGPARGALPALLTYETNIAGLREGSYSANIVVTVPNGSPRETLIPITVRVPAPPANPYTLFVDRVALSAAAGGTAESAVPIRNGSGSPATFRALIPTTATQILRVTPDEITVAPGDTGTFVVTTAPGAIAPGTYNATLALSGPNVTQNLPVSLTVSAIRSRLTLARTGFSFVGAAGGPVPSTQALFISGDNVSWTARAVSRGDWLRVAATSGTASLTAPSRATISADTQGLEPGDHYGRIEVTDTANRNNRRVATVLLQVLPIGADTGSIASPSVMTFSAEEGQQPAAQEMQLFIGQNRAGVWSASSASDDGAAWLNFYPNGGPVTGAAPGRLVIQPETAGLPAGAYRGAVTIAFDNGDARNVPVLLIITPRVTTASKGAVRETSACSGPNLLPLIASPLANFRATIGEPVRIAVRVVDQCGNPHVPESGGNAGVALTGIGPTSMNLTHTAGGVWEGTWTPPATQATVTLTALALFSRGTFLAAGADKISGSVGASIRPVVFNNSVTDAATFQFGAPLGPGTLVSFFGSNLSASSEVASSLPLPKQLGDVEVLVNDSPVPLLFAGPSQVNAQIPFELDPDSEFQIELRRGSALATPQTVIVSQARPGVFSVDQSGAGQGHIYIARANGTQTLAGAATPAVAGDIVIIYANGLGRTNPPVPAGQATPFTNLSPLVNPATVTIGGRNAAIQFAGLVPGFVGLYQINTVVPAGVTPSNAVPVVITVAGQQSTPATMAVR
jgi:uncharacterized protein (TIGR03437 family)